MTGPLVLLVVLGVALAFGLWRRRRDGRVTGVRLPSPASADLGSAAPPGPADAADVMVLDAGDLGVLLGSRATLVQFSSAFCQPCRAARSTLAHVAGSVDGVVHVEIDAESRLDLVRRMNVLRTPTTLVVDAAGRVVGRAVGAPRLLEVRAALPA